MRNGALLALVLMLAPALLPEMAKGRRGYAAHYRPNLMERVSRNRGLPIVDCMIAAEGRIGQWLNVRSRINGNVERCRITDVCAPRDCPRLRKAGIIVEFGWPAARRFCVLRRYGEKPPRDCPVEVF